MPQVFTLAIDKKKSLRYFVLGLPSMLAPWWDPEDISTGRFYDLHLVDQDNALAAQPRPQDKTMDTSRGPLYSFFHPPTHPSLVLNLGRLMVAPVCHPLPTQWNDRVTTGNWCPSDKVLYTGFEVVVDAQSPSCPLWLLSCPEHVAKANMVAFVDDPMELPDRQEEEELRKRPITKRAPIASLFDGHLKNHSIACVAETAARFWGPTLDRNGRNYFTETLTLLRACPFPDTYQPVLLPPWRPTSWPARASASTSPY